MADACGKVLRGGGGDYTKIGIVTPNDTISDYAVEFFTKYFLAENSLPDNVTYPDDKSRTVDFTSVTIPQFEAFKALGAYVVNGFTVERYPTIDELTKAATEEDTQPFCFGVDF